MKVTFEWQTASPESQNLNSKKLEALWDKLAAHNTRGFLLIKNDQIILEKYAQGWDAAKPHGTASLAKALVGGMSLALAMDEGLIDPDDLESQYVPQWKDDPRKARVTIRHLATHTSGLENAELSEKERAAALAQGVSLNEHHMSLPGWKGEFWRQDGRDPFTVSRDDAPVIFEPGTQYHYSNPGMAMLSYAITAALKNSPCRDVRSLLRERVMVPIGVADDEWSVGYKKTFTVDSLPLVANWGGGAYTARAAARIMRLMLNKGNWQGRQVLKAKTVEQLLMHADCPSPSGLGWWLNLEEKAKPRFPVLPGDAFWGSGAGHQVACAIPSLGVVFVRNGKAIAKEVPFNNLGEILFKPIVESLQ